jgi:hypothetical protein
LDVPTVTNTNGLQNKKMSDKTNNPTNGQAVSEGMEASKTKAPLDWSTFTDTEKKGIKKQIDSLTEDVKKKKGTNIIAAIKTLEEYAHDCKGDDNKKKRIAWLAAGLDLDPATIAESKAGVTALATMLCNLYTGNEAGENLDIQKKEKESEISESETALSTSFALTEVSLALQGLGEEDIRKVQAANHAAFQTTMKLLSTKENPFPRQAADLLSFLFGASGGSLDFFPCTDPFIVEASGMSKASVKRQRAKLIEWMNATGKGIVSIRQNAKKPTEYKVNLMEATSRIIGNMLATNNAPENVLIVANLSGKLLTEGTDKIRSEVSEDTLTAAKSLSQELTAAVDSMPKPSIKFSEASKGATADFTTKKFETLREKLGGLLEQASENALDDVSTDLEATAKAMQKAEAKFGKDAEPVDFTAFENALSGASTKIREASQSEADRLTAEANASTEPISPETRRSIAEANVKGWNAEERSQEQEEAEETFAFTSFLLAAIADIGKMSPEEKKNLFLKCQDTLQAAFQYGQYAETAGK